MEQAITSDWIFLHSDDSSDEEEMESVDKGNPKSPWLVEKCEKDSDEEAIKHLVSPGDTGLSAFHKGRLDIKEALGHFQHENTRVHHRLHCYEKHCSSISDEDRRRFDGKKDKFSHKWLEERGLSFCEVTEVWWLVYVEGKGMFCLLCRQNDEHNILNKWKVFNKDPSVRFKKSAVDKHRHSAQHKRAVQREMIMQRESPSEGIPNKGNPQ